MTKGPLLVFDFDGVLIDGMNEYWWSSKAACLQLIEQHCKPNFFPQQIPESFKFLRPWVHHGWEMVVIAAEVLFPKNQSPLDAKVFSENYSANIKEALKTRDWKPTALQKSLENVRHKALLLDKQAWISRHRPFPKVIERLNLFKDEGINWAVLTTKGSKFTSELLEYFELKPHLVHGRESGSKVDVLLKLATKYSLMGFVEDRLATLENVTNTPRLSSLPCYLASWGYLKPSDHMSLPRSIHLLDPETLATPLASWH